MTLFWSFYRFYLQVMEKLNLAFWTFDYFQNWLTWCYFKFKFHTFSSFANRGYPKKIYVETLVQRVHMLGPGLSNLQKGDNLVTPVNLINTFTTLIPTTGPQVLQKRPGEGVIWLQISDILKFYQVLNGLKTSHLVFLLPMIVVS